MPSAGCWKLWENEKGTQFLYICSKKLSYGIDKITMEKYTRCKSGEDDENEQSDRN